MKGCEESMKKLICAKQVEAVEKQGKKVLYIDSDTIITPSAKDAAANLGIEFSTEPEPCEAPACAASACEPAAPAAPAAQAPAAGGEIDTEVIYKALQALLAKGMLNGVLDGAAQEPYVAERDAGGCVKLVRGNTAKWEPLDTGNPSNKVFFNELIGADDKSSVNAGFMTIENCSFPWDVGCEEIYYVVEGTLTVGLDGRVFTAYPGDALFFQNGSKLTFGSPDKVKVFYATYSA